MMYSMIYKAVIQTHAEIKLSTDFFVPAMQKLLNNFVELVIRSARGRFINGIRCTVRVNPSTVSFQEKVRGSLE